VCVYTKIVLRVCSTIVLRVCVCVYDCILCVCPYDCILRVYVLGLYCVCVYTRIVLRVYMLRLFHVCVCACIIVLCVCVCMYNRMMCVCALYCIMCVCILRLCHVCVSMIALCVCVHYHYLTKWRRCTGCLRLQVTFRKRATNHRALLRKMTSNAKASCGSSPRCTCVCPLRVSYMCVY